MSAESDPMTPDEHKALDTTVNVLLNEKNGWTRAPLPTPEVEEQFLDLLDLAFDLAEGFEELLGNEDWVAWLSAGANQGKPEERGKWIYRADELAHNTRHLHIVLNKLAEAFEYRRNRNKERIVELTDGPRRRRRPPTT